MSPVFLAFVFPFLFPLVLMNLYIYCMQYCVKQWMAAGYFFLRLAAIAICCFVQYFTPRPATGIQAPPPIPAVPVVPCLDLSIWSANTSNWHSQRDSKQAEEEQVRQAAMAETTAAALSNLRFTAAAKFGSANSASLCSNAVTAEVFIRYSAEQQAAVKARADAAGSSSVSLQDSDKAAVVAQGAADRTATANAISARIIEAEAALQALSASERWKFMQQQFADAAQASPEFETADELLEYDPAAAESGDDGEILWD